jgi:ABC-type antimicrobial peptide transport system permease subunit
VTVLGAVVGFGAGAGFYFATGFVMNSGGLFSDFSVTNGTLVLGLGIALVVGLLSAALPALQATRTGIADALRYVG